MSAEVSSVNVKVCDECRERRNQHSLYRTFDGRYVCYSCLPGPIEDDWLYTWLGYREADDQQGHGVS